MLSDVAAASASCWLARDGAPLAGPADASRAPRAPGRSVRSATSAMPMSRRGPRAHDDRPWALNRPPSNSGRHVTDAGIRRSTRSAASYQLDDMTGARPQEPIVGLDPHARQHRVGVRKREKAQRDDVQQRLIALAAWQRQRLHDGIDALLQHRRRVGRRPQPAAPAQRLPAHQPHERGALDEKRHILPHDHCDAAAHVTARDPLARLGRAGAEPLLARSEHSLSTAEYRRSLSPKKYAGACRDNPAASPMPASVAPSNPDRANAPSAAARIASRLRAASRDRGSPDTNPKHRVCTPAARARPPTTTSQYRTGDAADSAMERRAVRQVARMGAWRAGARRGLVRRSWRAARRSARRRRRSPRRRH